MRLTRYGVLIVGPLLGCTTVETPHYTSSSLIISNNTCSNGQCESLVIVGVRPGAVDSSGRNYFVIGVVDSFPSDSWCQAFPESTTIGGHPLDTKRVNYGYCPTAG